ncbi:CLUMA_CG018574, isoform A [Clunio marinus]|uniref:CLUMA_CG018574, isoform A n=1 Tax=Clunio marinus TaxID=568069 RepID=A0A1J1IXY1_9DIPT|nr:CLUMA_CG018574, isoform A [Clunio marinus]
MPQANQFNRMTTKSLPSIEARQEPITTRKPDVSESSKIFLNSTLSLPCGILVQNTFGFCREVSDGIKLKQLTSFLLWINLFERKFNLLN